MDNWIMTPNFFYRGIFSVFFTRSWLRRESADNGTGGDFILQDKKVILRLFQEKLKSFIKVDKFMEREKIYFKFFQRSSQYATAHSALLTRDIREREKSISQYIRS